MRALSISAISKPQSRDTELRVSSLALWVGGLTLLGLALRLAWVFYTDTIPLGGDPHGYYVVGINIAQGAGFVASRNELWEIPGPGAPTAFWPPGYPFALGALFKIFGAGVSTAQMLNALLGALTIPFVYALGRRIFDVRAGLVAAGLFAIFPNVIASTPVLFPEPLFGLIFVAALWLLVAYSPAESNGWRAVAVFGVLTGMAALTRGEGTLLLPVAALYWLASTGWRQAALSTAIAAIAAVAIISPWTIRNAVELHAFVPISTNSGAVLRIGHNEDSIGIAKWTDDDVGGFRMWESLYRPDWEVLGYREYTNLAIEYALTHPVHEVELAGRKIYHLYRSDSTVLPWLTTLGATPLEPDGLERALRYVLDVAYYGLIFVAIASAIFWFRRLPSRWLLVNVLLVWTLFHVVFLGGPRYHIPLYPLFFIAAAGGFWAIYDRGRAVFDRRAASIGTGGS